MSRPVYGLNLMTLFSTAPTYFLAFHTLHFPYPKGETPSAIFFESAGNMIPASVTLK